MVDAGYHSSPDTQRRLIVICVKRLLLLINQSLSAVELWIMSVTAVLLPDCLPTWSPGMSEKTIIPFYTNDGQGIETAQPHTDG